MHVPDASDVLLVCHVVLLVMKGLAAVVAFQNVMANVNTVKLDAILVMMYIVGHVVFLQLTLEVAVKLAMDTHAKELNNY